MWSMCSEDMNGREGEAAPNRAATRLVFSSYAWFPGKKGARVSAAPRSGLTSHSTRAIGPTASSSG